MTTVVSTFTAHYVYLWPTYFPDAPLTPPLPSFDGRAILYPNAQALRDYMSWRQVDCMQRFFTALRSSRAETSQATSTTCTTRRSGPWCSGAGRAARRPRRRSRSDSSVPTDANRKIVLKEGRARSRVTRMRFSTPASRSTMPSYRRSPGREASCIVRSDASTQLTRKDSLKRSSKASIEESPQRIEHSKARQAMIQHPSQTLPNEKSKAPKPNGLSSWPTSTSSTSISGPRGRG